MFLRGRQLQSAHRGDGFFPVFNRFPRHPVHNQYPNQNRGRVRLLLGVCLVLLTGLSQAQMIDLNSNGMSDVWEWIYSPNGVVAPNTDSDGDGMVNSQEALAGTNPFDSNSVPKIYFISYAPTNFSVTVSNAWGKLYQLQSVQTLGDTNWVSETNVVARSSTTTTLTAPANALTKYFRISIADVDTDGDGVNDWEEYKLGLDPLNAASNGQLDGIGQPLRDYAYVTNKIAVQNVISISATDPVTTQPDPGQNATDLGVFTVTRGGFPLNLITVNLGLNGAGAGFATPGVDYVTLPGSVTLGTGVSSVNLNVTPLANTNLIAPVVAPLKLMPGTKYTLGTWATNASVLIYPTITANGTGLIGQYFSNSSVTFGSISNFNTTNLFLTRTDAVIDFTWTNGTSPNLSNGLYSVRWTGQVQPQYSETYFFVANTDDGVKLSINDQVIISKWVTRTTPADSTGTINLQAGVRYDLKMEYFNLTNTAGAHLSWYSASQAKQVIPSNRLYPTNSAVGLIAPTVITSPQSMVGFLGQLFSNVVTAANSPTGYSAKGMPPGLTLNATNGVINGTPTLAGDFQVALTATNAVGLGASILDVQIFDTGSSVVREVWTNVAGINVADIPLDTAAMLTNTLGTLEGVTDYGDNYGERLRGYLTAPVTGNYYFWIAASNAAELWISNDNEPANRVRRCYVTNSGTGPRQWTNQPSQKSPWLALVAGQKYYLEILHKAGTGGADNVSVGWLQDPTGTNTTPAGVVPGYVLSRYYPTPAAYIPGTLYSANLLALPGVNSAGVGSATLRVSADGSQAILNFQLNNLVGAVTAEHIDADPYLSYPAVPELFDISAAHQQTDGSYVWKIKDVSPLAAADILEILNEGKASIKIETSFAGGGEIGGHFTLANGAQTFAAPPAPPAWTEDSADANAAVRFLMQATFGAGSNDIVSVQSLGYAAWITNQFALPVTHALPTVVANKSADPSNPWPSSDWFNTWWQNAVIAPDQLRQRVAFALSEIMVVSESGTLQDHSDALAAYYDTLLDNSFGNYRALLKAVTLSPAMGVYLNMQGNSKGNIITGTHANENYAREINQLFSVGLNRLWPDGSLILSSSGNLVPTYNQNVINGFAATFTGWNYYQTNQASGRLPASYPSVVNYTNPMVLVPSQHDLTAKLLLDNIVLPPALGTAAVNATSNNDTYCSQDLEQALDVIYNNQNVGPYICRQLIQRLVTSNPSRDYLYRVVQKFNDNGTGVRGDLQVVVQAILLDYEARSTNLLANPTYGKQREPLLRVTATARALAAPASQAGTYAETGTQTNTITTPLPHRLSSGDTLALSFTDTSGNPAPPSQSYPVTVTGPNTFTVNVPNLLFGTYTQTNGIITVNISSHGLVADDLCYVVFTTGSGVTKRYQVLSAPSGNQFTVATTNTASTNGTCLMPKLLTAGYVQSGNVVTVSCAAAHGVVSNELFYIPANSVFLTPNIYSVSSVIDATHFTFLANANNTTQSGFSLYPLGSPPPPLTRSGNALVQWSTWKMGYTDSDPTYNLGQSPLSANTVFNFFFPNYEFPGALSAAGLTTPEFQLTSDTSVALQMNFLESGILTNSSSNPNNLNTNGLSSFTTGSGSIVLDIGPWMTTNYTSGANVPLLVENLNTRLLAGQLSAAAKTNIINFVTNTANFSYTTPVPTATQMRDRVRAVVHLLICSPDFTIQK